MFAGVSYAEIVKHKCNKRVNNNYVKSPEKFTIKTDSMRVANTNTGYNRVVKKYSGVIVPSKNHRSGCHSKPRHVQNKCNNIPTYNRFKVLQNLNENKESDENNMNVNTNASVSVKHLNRNVKCMKKPKNLG